MPVRNVGRTLVVAVTVSMGAAHQVRTQARMIAALVCRAHGADAHALVDLLARRLIHAASR
jgi:hypothetical protein